MITTPQHLAVPNRVRSLKQYVPRPIKVVTRHTLRRYGTLTSSSRTLPQFLIIGTKRGGTTSLWNWLVQHPQVAPMFPVAQQIKSPHYFDIRHHRGVAWYRSHFPRTRSLHSGQITGEASPYYMFHPLAPERIKDTLPRVKLIVALRNPVDRAYSHYWERRGGGSEPLTSFEEAVLAEEKRTRGEEDRICAEPGYYSVAHDHYTYLARGRYYEHLKRYFDLFDPSQIHIVWFDLLKADPVGTYTRVLEFLELDPAQPPREHHNKLPAPPLDPVTRGRLHEYFAPHNAQLRTMVDMPVQWLFLHFLLLLPRCVKLRVNERSV